MSSATYVALLRGINVSGHKLIKMDRLRASCEALGWVNVRTYLQSGNIVFATTEKSPLALAATLQKQILREFGFEVPTIILTIKDIDLTLKGNPFLTENGIDPATLHVTFLSARPDAAALRKLKVVPAQPDRFHAVGKLIYLHCPQGYGRTKLSNQALERILSVSATTRNWKTLSELARMLESTR